MSSIEEYIPKRRVSNRGNPREYVSCWTERDVLDGEVVNAMVVVLRTKGCAWARWKGCTMCGYINDCHQDVGGDDLKAQMEAAMERYADQKILKIFTSGSFLDEREVPEGARTDILSIASERFEQLVVESRPEFVKTDMLKSCISTVKDFQVAIGLESANDRVLRFSVNKGFLFEDYLDAARRVSESGSSLRTYLLIKPLFLTEQESIIDSVESAKRVSDISDVISFNPVNVQRGTLVEKLWRRGEYRPPWLWSVVQVLNDTKDLEARVISFPTGAGKSRGAHNCLECDSAILTQIEDFSLGLRSDFDLPDCGCRDRWRDILETQGFTQSSVDIERIYN